MEMNSKNISFNNFVSMEEKMTYTPDAVNPEHTVLRQETVVTVQGVPLTSYMEGIIVNTVSSNSSKGRAAMEWVVDKLGQECRALNLSSTLDKMKTEFLILPAKKSIEELQDSLNKLDLPTIPLPQPPILKAEDHNQQNSSVHSSL